MGHDVPNLIHWAHIVMVIAAVSATAFPVLYAFSEWYKTPLGRVLMYHGVVLALALDLTVMFFYWRPEDILVRFWITMAVYGLIITAMWAMSGMLVRINYIRHREKVKERSNDPTPAGAGSSDA